jgi:hypothetical protein
MEAHKQIKEYFLELEAIFNSFFGIPKNIVLPFQNEKHEWLNYFYTSPLFRHIHLEFYKTEKICVLHANIFSDPKIDLPTLGFDMIALGNKITGLFFDYTPTFTTFAKLDYDLVKIGEKYKSQKRQLPEWADFFSKNFYCVGPLAEELPSIIHDIKESINNTYFSICKDENLKYNLRIKKQNAYCEGQKKNDKTYKALAVEIGNKEAKRFLNKYLFPEIKVKNA